MPVPMKDVYFFSKQTFYNSITFFTDMMKISDDDEEEEDGGCCITEADAISEASLTLLQEAKEPFFATLMRGSSTRCSKNFEKVQFGECTKSSKAEFNVFWKIFFNCVLKKKIDTLASLDRSSPIDLSSILKIIFDFGATSLKGPATET